MGQDRESGAEGNRYGRETGAAVATLLGAKRLTKRSNESMLNGERVAIKCAAPKTDQVGVLTDMLGRVDAVLGCFEGDDGCVEVWRLTRTDYQSRMEASRSASHKPGSLMKARNKLFREKGRLVAAFTAAEVAGARAAQSVG